MFKNTTGQKLTVYVFDSTTNLPKTGDAGNLTAYYDLDDAGVTVLTDTSATEKDATNAKGFYIFDVAQAECNANKILFSCKSGTANMVCLAMPAVVYTTPAAFGLVPGAAGGLFISGTNSSLTITGATTLTGNVVLSDGLTVSAPSTSNRAGITITGNGTGAGIISTSGNGATGNGIQATSAATNGTGLGATGNGTGNGMLATGGAGAGGDGIEAAAGGGVAIRGGITGDITGNLSGSAGSVTGAVGSVTGAVASVTGAVGSVTGNVGGNVTGSVGSIATGGIASTSFAASALDAAAIAPNAIGASELATDACQEIADTILGRALAAESYAADTAVPTLSQVLYMLLANLTQFAITSTTISVKKLDGTTEAMTYTLDSATTPTSRDRAT